MVFSPKNHSPQSLSGHRDCETALVEKVLMHLLEEIVIVSVIYPNPDQNGAGDLKCLLERWPDLIRRHRS